MMSGPSVGIPDIVCWEDLDAFECPCGAMYQVVELGFLPWLLEHVKHSSGWCRHLVKDPKKTHLIRIAPHGGYYEIKAA